MMDDFETILPKLVKIQLFSDFHIDNEEDKRILKTVYENITLQAFKKGDVIIKEGDHGDSFYILYDGKVQVLRNTMAGDTIALAILSAEQNIFFGETALISKDERSATVKALTDCKTLVLSGKNSTSCVQRNRCLVLESYTNLHIVLQTPYEGQILIKQLCMKRFFVKLKVTISNLTDEIC